MIEKIVSGGQTGVDQAALSMAKDAGIAIGGWCPKGGLDANGVNVLPVYSELKEATTTNPDERTQLNIEDSDGTLIIVPCMPLPVSIVDGTRLTIDYAMQKNKPYLVVSLEENDAAVNDILHWIDENRIAVLNIGGPRESSWPGIHQTTCILFQELFAELVRCPQSGMNSSQK